ncbi:MAG: hypothetical protein IJV00_05155 [Clostridia bacterium]|nr:hypothetical protein [Clostridia bacterium]
MNGQYNPNPGQAPQQPQYQAPQQPQYQPPQQPQPQYQPPQQPQYQAPQAPQQPASPKAQIPVKLIACIGGAVVALVVLILIISSCGGGGFMNPINKMIEIENKKSVNLSQSIDAATNGFMASDFKTLYNDLKKLEDYKDADDKAKESAEDAYKALQDEYGDNFHISFNKEEQDKIESKDLKSVRDNLRSQGESLAESLKSYKDLSNTEKGELADKFDVKKADLDKIYNDLKKIADTIKNVKIDEGYEVGGTIKITGKELDEPDETHTSFEVYKVNGTWVQLDTFRGLLRFASSIANQYLNA